MSRSYIISVANQFNITLSRTELAAWAEIAELFKEALQVKKNKALFSDFFKNTMLDIPLGNNTRSVTIDPKNSPWFNFFLLCNHLVLIDSEVDKTQCEEIDDVWQHYLIPVLEMAIQYKIYPTSSSLLKESSFRNGTATTFSIMINTLKNTAYNFFYFHDARATLPKFILAIIEKLNDQATFELFSKKTNLEQGILLGTLKTEIMSLVETLKLYFKIEGELDCIFYFSKIADIINLVIKKCSPTEFKSLFLTSHPSEKNPIEFLIQSVEEFIRSFKISYSLNKYSKHKLLELCEKADRQFSRKIFQLFLNVYDQLHQLKIHNIETSPSITKKTKELLILASNFHQDKTYYATIDYGTLLFSSAQKKQKSKKDIEFTETNSSQPS